MKYVLLGTLSTEWAAKHGQRIESATAKLEELGITLEAVMACSLSLAVALSTRCPWLAAHSVLSVPSRTYFIAHLPELSYLRIGEILSNVRLS